MKKIKTLVKEYVRLCKQRRLSKNYIAEQQRVLFGMIAWIGKQKPSDYQTYELWEFLEAEPCSSWSKVKRVNIIKSFWSWVKNNSDLKANPAEALVAPARDTLKDIFVPNITTELIKEIAEKADPNTGLGPLVVTVWACALRVEAALRLSIRDLNERTMVLRFAHVPDHYTLENINLLLAYLVRLHKMKESAIRRVWKHSLDEITDEIGCEPLRVADIRNGCINRWINEGYTPESIMEWSEIKTTKTLWRHYRAANLENIAPGPLYEATIQ
jgi:hypothetical protein